MAISYQFNVVDEILFVTASGFDESLEETQAYGLAVMQACLEHDIKRVLLDETNLEYRLTTVETFQLAKMFAEFTRHIPGLYKAALVCSPDYISDGIFWEDMVVNRGAQVRVYTNYDDAYRWVGFTHN